MAPCVVFAGHVAGQSGPLVPPLFTMHGQSILTNQDVVVAKGGPGLQQLIIGDLNMKGWSPSPVVTSRAPADLDGLCTNSPLTQ